MDCRVVCFALILIFASSKLMVRYGNIEKKFIDNLNIRENTRLGINNNLVSDLHQAYIQVVHIAPLSATG